MTDVCRCKSKSLSDEQQGKLRRAAVESFSGKNPADFNLFHSGCATFDKGSARKKGRYAELHAIDGVAS